ncbi:LacI family DNA-binding transcriptional regulator [Martelella radicis]|uniref:LacI family transcriptional regulator n=1 Tax=Martelella radicis TaxID=1397476 RepID=A0A7W6P7X0_9HYPH|nr:LacI family DNA-binding transcriptional regulator [Martelella radicis]MBB4120607.1 LacI family transcriptional regulator [Martelella radicis]
MTTITLKDVAERANVSIATVDRVLHERAGVSARARQRVKEAIHDLGFGQLPVRLTRAARGKLRFLFLMPGLETEFVRNLYDGLKKARTIVPDVEIQIEVQRVSLADGKGIIAALEHVGPDRFNGVGVFAVDAPGVRQAIDETVDRGVPVVTLVSDVPLSRRAHFVGIDNVAAGRTAGRLMGKFLRGVSGSIGLVTGNQHMRDHVERHMGFRQIIGMDYRGLKMLPPVEGESMDARNRSIVIDLMRDHGDLAGIYSIGAGNGGIITAIEEMQPARRPVVILHELTRQTRKALAAGAVDAIIVQDTGHMTRSIVRLLSSLAFSEEHHDDQEKIRIEIFLAENDL